MSMHLHVDRRPILTATLEESPRIPMSLVDQIVCVPEVDRRDPQRAGRREHDQLRLAAMAFDVRDQPALGEQADRVQRHRQRAG
jgi:hypothetical protein